MSWLFSEPATPEKTLAPRYESDIFARQVSSAEKRQLRDEKDEHAAKNVILAEEKDALNGELFARQVSSQEKIKKLQEETEEHSAANEELLNKVAELERIKNEMQDTIDTHRGNQRTCAACTVS